MRIAEVGSVRIQYLDDDGAVISTANDVIGDAWGSNANLVAIPVTRLDPAFFHLSTGVAGEFAQKFVNYRLHLAIVGDLSAQVAASSALADWVWESNRGTQVWFVPDATALETLVAARFPA